MSESNPDVLKAVRLLVGDIVNKERYIMLPAEPGEGDPVLGKFRTVSDAKRFASRSDIDDFSLWTRLKVVGGDGAPEAAAVRPLLSSFLWLPRRLRPSPSFCCHWAAETGAESAPEAAEAEAARAKAARAWVASGWTRRSCGSGLSRWRHVGALIPSLSPLLPQKRLLVLRLRDVEENRARLIPLSHVLQALTWFPPNARQIVADLMASKAHIQRRARGCECQLEVPGALMFFF